MAAALQSPVSKSRVRFVNPQLSEPVTVPEPRLYELRLEISDPEPDALGIDVALDDERPRRLMPPQYAITLGQLLAAERELSPGLHWLFAAPIAASGLVPRAASGARSLAIARPFLIGKADSVETAEHGATWLRRPEGTYNGSKSAERVLFEAFSFAPSGEPLLLPYVISLRGPKLRGEIRMPTPFALVDIPSGEFEVSVAAGAIAPLTVRFTVNRELSAAP